jgi:hypothetical protein
MGTFTLHDDGTSSIIFRDYEYKNAQIDSSEGLNCFTIKENNMNDRFVRIKKQVILESINVAKEKALDNYREQVAVFANLIKPELEKLQLADDSKTLAERFIVFKNIIAGIQAPILQDSQILRDLRIINAISSDDIEINFGTNKNDLDRIFERYITNQ